MSIDLKDLNKFIGLHGGDSHLYRVGRRRR